MAGGSDLRTSNNSRLNGLSWAADPLAPGSQQHLEDIPGDSSHQFPLVSVREGCSIFSCLGGFAL